MSTDVLPAAHQTIASAAAGDAAVNLVLSAAPASSLQQQQQQLRQQQQQQQQQQQKQPVPSSTSSATSATAPASEPLPPMPLAGQYTLADFQLLDTLGTQTLDAWTGTFGRVHLSRTADKPQVYYAMKVLKKSEVVRLRQVEHMNSEKAILAQINHPFIVNLQCTYQDAKCLYMLLDYVPGGELFSHLRRAGRFNRETTRFYASEIVTAIEHLHDRNIIYRDLKPENLLLDAEGHIKIADFGFAKKVEDRTYTLCGTPEYLAPEIIQGRGHGKPVDWWALGILIFEMLAGYPPFYDDNAYGVYEKILGGRIHFPSHFDVASRDLVKRLLTADRTMRLGNLRGGAEDVKSHPWFMGVDWAALVNRQVRAPLVPRLDHPGDTRNFDRYPDALPDDSSDDDPHRELFLEF
ncbi:cytochrome c oxidase subunit 1 [Sorochytrium milnesiophthora]